MRFSFLFFFLNLNNCPKPEVHFTGRHLYKPAAEGDKNAILPPVLLIGPMIYLFFLILY